MSDDEPQMWLTARPLRDPDLPPRTIRIKGVVYQWPPDDDYVNGPNHRSFMVAPRGNSPDPSHCYAEGYKAGEWGASRSACPWAPGAEEGREWLQGWLNGARDYLEYSGVMAGNHIAAEREVRRSVEKDPLYRPDPTAILEQEEEPEDWRQLGARVVHDWMKEEITRWAGGTPWPRQEFQP